MLSPKVVRYLILIGLLNVCNAQAFDFTLSEREFKTWDNKCQALYVSTNIGSGSIFSRMVNPADVKYYRRLDNEGGWHYCAGLIYIKRAKLAVTDPAARDFNYEKAHGEIMFTYSRVNKSSLFNAQIEVTLANLYSDTGEIEKAKKLLNRVIQQFPQYSPGYSAKAILLNKLDKRKEAIKTLINAPQSVLKNSAEINYFLGLFYLDEGEIENAKKYATLAYQLGYPLPGLQFRINEMEKK